MPLQLQFKNQLLLVNSIGVDFCAIYLNKKKYLNGSNYADKWGEPPVHP